MTVIHYPDDVVAKQPPSLVTIGVFDGVHHGHRSLIQEVVKQARTENRQAVAITFEPHPQIVLGQHSSPVRLLASLSDRLKYFKELGIDTTIICRFTRELSFLTADEFLIDLRERFGFDRYLLGPNHTFGYKRSGNRETLPEVGVRLGLQFNWVSPVVIEGQTVSSSLIRQLLLQGELALANNLLGSTYSVSGYVVTGEQRGRELGVPTANVIVDPADRLIPADGVYIASVDSKDLQRFPAVVSIGTRPTFGELPRAIEAHLLDFNGDLYGRKITVRFLKYLRGQVAYRNIDDLIRQIQLDIDATRSYFESNVVTSVSK